MMTGSLASILLTSLISLWLVEAQASAGPPTPPLPTRRAAASRQFGPPIHPAAAARPPAVRARAHGISLSGRVSGVDSGRKTFSIRDVSGRETSLAWTAATKISGGDLKVGEPVTLRYLDKDTRHIATTIKIEAPIPSPPLTPGSALAAAKAPASGSAGWGLDRRLRSLRDLPSRREGTGERLGRMRPRPLA